MPDGPLSESATLKPMSTGHGAKHSDVTIAADDTDVTDASDRASEN